MELLERKLAELEDKLHTQLQSPLLSSDAPQVPICGTAGVTF